MLVIYHNSYLITTKKDFIQEILIIKCLDFVILNFPKSGHLTDWMLRRGNTSV